MRIIVIFAIIIVGVASVWAFQDKDNSTVTNEAPMELFTTQTTPVDFETQVKPVLDQRCVVCHACYDAPCQLKLSSPEGIQRGAHKDKVYDGERLLAASPNRLHIDAIFSEQWRERGFHSVIPDNQNNESDTPQSHLKSSAMAQLLLQKKAQPLPTTRHLPDSFKLSLNADYSCPTTSEISEYRADQPLGGMPYGLPSLPDNEHDTLIQWISQGALMSPRDPLPSSIKKEVERWETFLNQNSLQAQLMGRYLYEHLFLANLWFERADKPIFFKLLRSKTPPGSAIDIINTRSPLDGPNVERVYYRFQQHVDTLVNKTHMPYQLDSSRMAKWEGWFLNPEISVNSLPQYEAKQRGNPFQTFKDIPLDSRYRFLLDEAQFTIMGFIKGPVCRGQIALNVINDHFWVSFVDPDLPITDEESQFLQQNAGKLTLPASDGANANPLQWLLYTKQEESYLTAHAKFFEKQLAGRINLDTKLIWDGDGENKNAGLTIFRHLDNATVVQGLQGTTPQTAWVISYPLLERIHYLLVAGFDVYGNVGHQLNSRIYMDFLRMEGEYNFLSLLPTNERKKVRGQWYRGALSPIALYLEDRYFLEQDSDIDYSTNQPLTELYQLLQKRLAAVHNPSHDLEKKSAVLDAFSQVNNKPNLAAQHLPQTTFIAVTHENKSNYFTLLHQMQFSNISHLFNSKDRRLPDEDTLLLLNGFVGAHPEAFLKVEQSELPQLARAITSIRSSEDWESVMDNYGVRRNDPGFWKFSDELHKAQAQVSPITAALFDYNRLKNQ